MSSTIESKRRLLLRNESGFNNLVPMVLAVIITFALIFVGIFILGVVNKNLVTNLQGTGSVPARMAMNSLNNSSKNFDSVLSVINIAIIITVLAMAIGAIFLFTRVGG